MNIDQPLPHNRCNEQCTHAGAEVISVPITLSFKLEKLILEVTSIHCAQTFG